MISIKESNGIIERSIFINNEATVFSQNIFLSFSNTQVKTSQFEVTNERNPLTKV